MVEDLKAKLLFRFPNYKFEASFEGKTLIVTCKDYMTDAQSAKIQDFIIKLVRQRYPNTVGHFQYNRK